MTITKEQVQAKRYKNSDRVPQVGDVIETGSSLIGKVTVGQIGDIPAMFQNCKIKGVFVLTHPEDCLYVGA